MRVRGFHPPATIVLVDRSVDQLFSSRTGLRDAIDSEPRRSVSVT